jgi:hypothetical protein
MNCQALSEQTSVSSPFLIASLCLLSTYSTVNSIFFFHFYSDYPTSGLTATGLPRPYFTYIKVFKMWPFLLLSIAIKGLEVCKYSFGMLE